MGFHQTITYSETFLQIIELLKKIMENPKNKWLQGDVTKRRIIESGREKGVEWTN